MPDPPATIGHAHKVWNRSRIAPARTRRSCRDNRPYFTVPWTIPAVVAAASTTYTPGWVADRDYWIARFSANAGNEHNSGTHPNDGAADGGNITFQFRRTLADLSTVGNILASDTRLRILDGDHQDSVSNGSDGVFARGDLNIARLREGDIVHPRIISYTDSGVIELTMLLVPYPWPGRD